MSVAKYGSKEHHNKISKALRSKSKRGAGHLTGSFPRGKKVVKDKDINGPTNVPFGMSTMSFRPEHPGLIKSLDKRDNTHSKVRGKKQNYKIG